MSKRLVIILACLGMAFAVTSVTYSQDAATTAPAPTTDTTAPAVDQPVAETAPAAPTTNAEKAMSYSDGTYTFVNAKALFRLSSRDNFLSDKVLYTIDGGAEQAYEKEFAIEAEGKHTITYYGVDKMANKEDPKSFSVTVDNTAPEVSVSPKFPIFEVNGKLFISKQYSFNIAATDTLSGVKGISYTINGKDYTDYATAFSIYIDGDITFSASALDNVGNKSTKFRVKVGDTIVEKDSLQLFADNVAPSLTIAADKQLTPINGKNMASKDFKYAVTAEDKDSGVKSILVRADGRGDFVPYDKEIFFNTNGDHFVEAKAIDATGNISDTVILSVYVDSTPPSTEIKTIAD